jgi:magnesium transporter
MVSSATLLEIINRFVETDPDKAVLTVESLSPRESAGLLKILDADTAMACLERMQHEHCARILELLPAQTTAAFLGKFTVHKAADIIRRMDKARSANVFAALDPQLALKVKRIFSYPQGTAGRLMRPDYTAFREDITIEHAIAKLRAMTKGGIPIGYCYVVDAQDALCGVLNMRDLVLCEPAMKLSEVMRKPVVSVNPLAAREVLAEFFSVRHFLVLPVTDDNHHLIGVVAPDSLIETANDQAGEDMQTLFGADAAERVWSPWWFKVTHRLPWLKINLATAFLAGAIVLIFKGLIAKIAILAVFLPIITGQGGNAGVQSLSVVLRGIITREVAPGTAWRLIGAEVLAGFINGVAVGLVTALAAWLWNGNIWFGLAAGLAMTITMVTAGFAGASVPLAMKKMNIDPANASGIVVTTITDIVGIFTFLGLAWLLQGKLL